MRELLLLLCIISLVSCVETGDDGYAIQSETAKNHLQMDGYYLTNLDGCEYLVSTHGKQLSHKGNCSNPIHECKCKTI